MIRTRIKRNSILHIFKLLSVLVFAGIVLSGCNSGNDQNESASNVLAPVAAQNQPEPHSSVNIDVEDDDTPDRMISYDVTTIGRGNPFMPYNEMLEYEKARNSAIAEANARNAKIIRAKR